MAGNGRVCYVDTFGAVGLVTVGNAMFVLPEPYGW